MTSGYSGTALATKLTLKNGMRVWTRDMPAEVRAEIDRAGLGIHWLSRLPKQVEAAHLFVIRAAHLAKELARLRRSVADNGMVWVSWPKRASGQATDITEDTVRALALPLGFVDVKVCAVDAVWSGLKLVVRKELRRG